MQTAIEIIDESGGKQLSGNSLATLEDSPFKNYVTTISQHVLTKTKEMEQCQGNLENNPEIQLVFVYRPLIASGKSPQALPVHSESKKSDRVKYLDSPWVKLTIDSGLRRPKGTSQLVVKGVFLWSERQFLFDQAMMSGARNAPTQPLLPIEETVFDKYIEDYTNSVLLASSPEDRSTGQELISKRLPVDILWLFRNAWQSTFAPFSMEVDHALRSTVQKVEIGYTDITKTLIQQSISSSKTEIRYAGILDLNSSFSIDKYQIKRPN
jgi:hypothetical protein